MATQQNKFTADRSLIKYLMIVSISFSALKICHLWGLFAIKGPLKFVSITNAHSKCCALLQSLITLTIRGSMGPLLCAETAETQPRTLPSASHHIMIPSLALSLLYDYEAAMCFSSLLLGDMFYHIPTLSLCLPACLPFCLLVWPLTQEKGIKWENASFYVVYTQSYTLSQSQT